MDEPKSKAHRERKSGRKALKKKAKKKPSDGGKNAKAFTYKSAIKAARATRRTLDVKSKKQRLPKVDRTPLEPPPVCVAVVGPPKVGKSTLIKGLIKNYTRQKVTAVQGPVTTCQSVFIILFIYSPIVIESDDEEKHESYILSDDINVSSVMSI